MQQRKVGDKIPGNMNGESTAEASSGVRENSGTDKQLKPELKLNPINV